MSTNTLTKQVAQTCQWFDIPGVKATRPCRREATLTGQHNSGGAQHLCTQHMRAHRGVKNGAYAYQYVWPCTTNGFCHYPATAAATGGRALSATAAAMTR